MVELLNFDGDKLSHARYEQLKTAVEQIIVTDSEPIVYERGLLEHPSLTDEVGGRMRHINVQSENTPDGSVDVSYYNEDNREFIGSELSKLLDLEVGPVTAHIRFNKTGGNSGVHGALYVLQGGESVKGYITCEMRDDKETLGEGSEACYDFLEKLGLEKIWAKHLYSGELHNNYLFDVSNRIAEDMTSFLNGLDRQP